MACGTVDISSRPQPVLTSVGSVRTEAAVQLSALWQTTRRAKQPQISTVSFLTRYGTTYCAFANTRSHALGTSRLRTANSHWHGYRGRSPAACRNHLRLTRFDQRFVGLPAASEILRATLVCAAGNAGGNSACQPGGSLMSKLTAPNCPTVHQVPTHPRN
jgi:hypothetical protein